MTIEQAKNELDRLNPRRWELIETRNRTELEDNELAILQEQCRQLADIIAPLPEDWKSLLDMIQRQAGEACARSISPLNHCPPIPVYDGGRILGYHQPGLGEWK